MKVIRILLCDDQPLFRKGLRILLSLQPDFEVVDEAANGVEAIELAKKHRPAVVLMDLQMPGLDGIAATRRVRAELPACQVIALTTFDDDENVFEGLRAGAIGYLLKDVPPEKLFEAIRLSARGESFIHHSCHDLHRQVWQEDIIVSGLCWPGCISWIDSTRVQRWNYG